jgi:hypothetical protein
MDESQSQSDGLRTASTGIREAYTPLLDGYDVAHAQPPSVHPFVADSNCDGSLSGSAEVLNLKMLSPRSLESVEVEYEKKTYRPR